MKHRFTIEGMMPHGEEARFGPFLITALIQFSGLLLMWGGFSWKLDIYVQLAKNRMLDPHQRFDLFWMFCIPDARMVHVFFAIALLFGALHARSFYNFYYKTGIRYVMMRVENKSDMWFRILSLPVIYFAICVLLYLGTFAYNFGKLAEIISYVAKYA